MGQERLSSLALVMQIHYQVRNVLDEVVNLFATNTHGGWSSGENSERLLSQYFDVSFFIVKLIL